MGTDAQPAPGEPADPEQGTDEGSTLGTLLRSAREGRGLSLQQIFTETRIPLRHLEALERDSLSTLPPGVYLRSEVRAYAKAVHLDPDVALHMLDRALALSDQEEAPAAVPPSPSPMTRPMRHIIVSGVGVLLVVAASLVFWRLGTNRSSTATPATSRAPVTSDDSAGAAATGTLARETPDSPLEPAPTSATSGAAVPDDQSRDDTVLAPAPLTDSANPALTGERGAPLTVVTEPPGARVTVNGIGWGTSPVTIKHLEPGEKRIRASLDGYEAAERVVGLGGSQPGKITLRLRPIE